MLSQNKGKENSYGLIHMQISPQERRKKQIYLSEKGKNIMSGLSNTIDDLKT